MTATEPAELMPLVDVPRAPRRVDLYQLALNRWQVERENQENNTKRRLEIVSLLVANDTECWKGESLHKESFGHVFALARPWALVRCDFCGDVCKEYVDVKPRNLPRFDICIRCHAFCLKVWEVYRRSPDAATTYLIQTYDPKHGSWCDCYHYVQADRPPGKCDRCYVPRLCFTLPLLNGAGTHRLRALIDTGELTENAASKLSPEEALPFVRQYTPDMPPHRPE